MSSLLNTNVNPLGAVSLSTNVFNVVLVANTAKTLQRNQFPAGATHVLINSTVAGLFVKNGGTAEVPVADVVDGTGVTIDPVFVDLQNVSSLSFINAAACIVSLSFFKKA